MITMPGIAFTIVTADWLVRLVLGPQWIEASRIYSILAISAFVQPVGNSTGWLFMSQGRSREMFQWGVFASTLIVLSFFLGLPWGATGVAAAYSATMICIMPALLWFVGRRGPVHVGDFYRVIAPFAVASVVALGSAWAFRIWVLDPTSLARLPAVLAVTLAAFFGSLAAIPAGRRELRDLTFLKALIK
jgi:PST family polysaccharide transporter